MILSEEDHVRAIRRVIEKALSVFGHPDSAAWINSEVAALGGVPPGSLIDTEEGRAQVMACLDKIEHGVL